jgi:hypothetical protein
VDADAHFAENGFRVFPVALFEPVESFRGRAHGIYRVGIVGHRQSAGAHISVADGFDFFEAVFFTYFIEGEKTLVQFVDELFRGQRSDSWVKLRKSVNNTVAALVEIGGGIAVRAQFLGNFIR